MISVQTFFLCLGILIGGFSALVAGSAELHAIEPARHYRVDEGVFELEIGKSIDLTDRKILLSVKLGHRGECCHTYLNGENVSTRGVGKRIDLKRERATREFVSDKRSCFLDLVDVALPQGAKGFATYRLYCL